MVSYSVLPGDLYPTLTVKNPLRWRELAVRADIQLFPAGFRTFPINKKSCPSQRQPFSYIKHYKI